MIHFCVLLVLLILCLASLFPRLFSSSPTEAFTATYTFNLNTPLYIRRNGKTCYYNGKVIALPSSSSPYYTVEYTNGTHNPNGKKKCTERIHKDDFYTGGGNTTRGRKRVLRNEGVDVSNKAFVSEYTGWSGYNTPFCYPRKLTERWNRFYPQKLPTAINLQQTHYELVSVLLNSLLAHTYVNVYVKDVNGARIRLQAPLPFLSQFG